MTGHKFKLVVALAIVALAALVAAGCGTKEDGASGGSDKLAADQSFVINGVEPSSLDPALFSDVDSLNASHQMFASLYRIIGEDSEVVPYLATELPEISDDGLTYTVRLRDDAKWSNGEPVTAEDVVYGVQRSLAPETGAYFAAFMDGIVGACEYNSSGPLGEGEAAGDDEAKCDGFKTDRSAEQIGVKAVDEHTVEFKLERQVPWFDQLLSVNTFWPVPKETVEKFKDKWTDPENIVTSGPFHLDSWKHKSELVMVKSKTFWDADDITLDKVTVKMISNPQTALKEFEKGDIDAGYTRIMVSPEDIDDWKSDSRYRSVTTTSTNYVYFNTRNEKLKDPKVRQGLSKAIDRPTIIEQITKRGDVPLNTVIPTTMPGFDTIKEGSQDFIGAEDGADVDKAKELLAEGGWKDGDTLNIYFTTESSTASDVVESMQSDFAKVGVKLKLVPLPTGAELYAPGVGTSPVLPKVDMVLLGWGADYLDPQDFYQLFTCSNVDGGLNTANYCNKEFDKLYQEGLTTIDKDARLDLYKQMEAMLTGPEGDMPAAPLYTPKDDTVVQPWVKGFDISPSSLFFYDDVKIYERS